MSQALIVGIDSELGKNIEVHLKNIGWSVFGTSRRKEQITQSNFYLDATDIESIEKAIISFVEVAIDWELVVVAIGRLSPIGRMAEVNFDEWRDSFEVNFVNQMFLLKVLLEHSSKLPIKNRKILTFAGSGTNSAPQNFTSYTLAKVSLIKAMELLAVEYPTYTFLSLGTGWMKSAIHQQTIEAGERAGLAYAETLRRIEANDFGDPQDLLAFIDWYLECSNKAISGRNIALQGDEWKSHTFVDLLTINKDSFKLRRSV